MIRAKTIYALSTPIGRSAIAVIRLTGPDCVVIAQKLAPQFQVKPRVAQFVNLCDDDNALLDKALLLYFQAPNSFTGEDLLELHLHGSPAVIKKISSFLSSLPNLRIADPGEFTQRAFYNEKLDLTQVEALSHLLQAETEAQRKQALRHLDGEVSQQISVWREGLLEIVAFVEAEIDFVEGEIPDSNLSYVNQKTGVLMDSIKNALDSYHRGSRIREGFHVAITGKPNVGKSSLLNKLSKRETAIVSEIAGTTRDVIEVHLEIDGFPVVLYDTAGIRETCDLVEQMGVARAKQVIDSSDFTIHVFDAIEDLPKTIAPNALYVFNKIDLIEHPIDLGRALPISSKKGIGIEELTKAIASFMRDNVSTTKSLILSNQRQYDLVKRILLALERSLDIKALEIKSEYLREALLDMGRIIGKIDIEEVLGSIFSSFCIGK